jgi:hypothetical protein
LTNPSKAIILIIMKKCSKCNIEKSLSEFPTKNSVKSGYNSRCKSCENARHRNRYTIPENKNKIKEYFKKSYEEYPERYRATSQRYRDSHPEKVKEWAKRARMKKSATIKGRLNDNMGNGIYRSLINGSKGWCAWEVLVGYTVEDLKKHLEGLFQPGMNWGNYGLYGWHVDHRIPLAVFNFQKPSDLDFHKAWSLKNLQPLWATENLKKQAKIDKPFQPSLLLNYSPQ